MPRSGSLLFLLVQILIITFSGPSSAQDNEVYRVLISFEIDSAEKSVTVLDNLKRHIKSLDAFVATTKDTAMKSGMAYISPSDSAIIVSSRSSQRSELKPGSDTLPDSLRIDYIPERGFQQFFRKKSHDGWSLYYRSFPGSGGHFEFSPVRYSNDGQFAVFYHQQSKHGLYGHGAIVILKKSADGRWKIYRHLGIWVS